MNQEVCDHGTVLNDRECLKCSTEQEQRLTHTEAIERIKTDSVSQDEAIRSTMSEFDSRIEDLQKFCTDSASDLTKMRLQDLRIILRKMLRKQAVKNG